MIRSLNRLTAVTLVCFVAVSLSLVYWSVIVSDTLLSRGDNPRRVEYEQGLLRGQIMDRNGTVLAQSVPGGESLSGKPVVRRSYPQPAAIGAVGYYSLVHGVGGTEEAFDATLRGDDRLTTWEKVASSLLHRPQQGSDVRLTLDLPLQQKLFDAMKGERGAVIVIEVPSGAVRAMVSLPSYDPGALDKTFDALIKAPDAPLLNRVTQGTYQPGGVLEPIILSALLTKGGKLDSNVTNGSAPLSLNGLTLSCGVEKPVQTIQDAFSYTCPGPFANITVLYRTEVQTALDAFGLTHSPRLIGFRTLSGKSTTPLFALANDETLLTAQGAGQGALTVTPLQMALVAAAIANDGQSVTPYLADAVRTPGLDWVTIKPPTDRTAVISADVAGALRVAMRDSVRRGTAQPAATGPGEIFGHASYAYSGPQDTPPVQDGHAISWFIGFIDRPDGTSLVVAVALEDTLDPAAAAKLGGLVWAP